MTRASKPKLVRIGKHFVDPTDVAGIKNCKDGLYLLRLKSEPNPEYPMWLSEREVERALEHFDITGSTEL